MPYTPPLGNAANVDLADDGAYVVPAGNAADVDFAATGAGFVAGDANITEGADTVTATGGTAVQGTASATEGADTVTADGTQGAIVGTANITEGADTATADGVQSGIVGTASIAETADTTDAFGAKTWFGDADIVEGTDTTSATGSVLVLGTSALTETADTTTADSTHEVIGTFNKNETANTLTASGVLNVGITLSAQANEANRTHYRKMYAGPVYLFPAPFTYANHASPLGTLTRRPLSTAVTVGQKFLFNEDWPHCDYAYMECVTAGTTSASNTFIPPAYQVGVSWNDGSATWRLRYFHGWSRATTRIRYTSVDSHNYINEFPRGTMPEWTVIAKSTHAQTQTSTDPGLWYMDPNCRYAPRSVDSLVGYYGISVNGTPAIPVEFAAGASMLDTGDYSAQRFDNWNSSSVGLMRGFTLGRDNTAATNLHDLFEWGYDVRYYDCTLQTNKVEETSGAQFFGHTSVRHSTRCTYSITTAAATAPPVLGMTIGFAPAVLEVPTLSRAAAASTPLIRATNWHAYLSGYPLADNSIFLLGADLTSHTGGVTYEPTAGVGDSEVMTSGGTFRAFGCTLKSSAIATPSNIPIDLTWTSQGGTNVGEYHPQRYIAGSVRPLDQSNRMSAPSEYDPTMTRNTTYTRSGGASDALGSFSYKVVMGFRPSLPLALEWFNTKIDESFLVTIEFEWSSTGTGLTTLKDEDVWLEAVYLNHATLDTSTLVFSFDKYNRRGLIYNHADGPPALATSGATWAGALGSSVKQKVSVVVSPKKAGPIKLYLGTWLCPWTQNITTLTPPAATLALYVCPLPTLSAAP